jgi:RNA polymerase sigma-70 factor (ECF subfamily)
VLSSGLERAVPAETSSGGVDLTDALSAAQTGAEWGFIALYRDLQPRMLRYVAALVGFADAEDVMAEAWLHVARDLGRFRGDVDGFRGWVSTISRNRAVDHLRSRARQPLVIPGPGHGGELTAAGDTAVEALTGISTRAAIEMIASLPQVEAEAVLLRVVVGLDGPTAAAVLGKRPGTVRVAAHRGLKRLARNLDRTEVADARKA